MAPALKLALNALALSTAPLPTVMMCGPSLVGSDPAIVMAPELPVGDCVLIVTLDAMLTVLALIERSCPSVETLVLTFTVLLLSGMKNEPDMASAMLDGVSLFTVSP